MIGGRQLSRASQPRSRASTYNIAHDHEFLTLDIPDVKPQVQIMVSSQEAHNLAE